MEHRLCWSLQHFIDSNFVLIPLFTVAPIFIGNLPLLVWILLTFLKTSKLCILVNLNPEFQDDSAPIGELLFKFIDFGVCTLPVIFLAEAFQTLYHHPSIPGAVKQDDVSAFGQILPESPQIVAGKLIRFWSSDRDYLITARVQSTGNAFDVAAFSSGVPTFIGKDYRNLPTVDLVMQLRKLFLIEFQLFLYSSRLIS